jgi:hypothetical protein
MFIFSSFSYCGALHTISYFLTSQVHVEFAQEDMVVSLSAWSSLEFTEVLTGRSFSPSLPFGRGKSILQKYAVTNRAAKCVVTDGSLIAVVSTDRSEYDNVGDSMFIIRDPHLDSEHRISCACAAEIDNSYIVVLMSIFTYISSS